MQTSVTSNQDAIEQQTKNKPIPAFIQWGSYPLLLLSSLSIVAVDIQNGTPGASSIYISVMSISVLLLLEYFYPMQQRWQMNWHYAKRDGFFIVVAALSIALSNELLLTLTLSFAPKHGLIESLPLLPGTLVALLVFQLFQYGLHRAEHELPGKPGRFGWRIHRPHHVCDRLYLFMHGRGHPVDAFLTRAVYLLPVALLGTSAESLYLLVVIINLQGLVSHLNVDLRAGWFNYLLTGTELHRYHHSSDSNGAKNYGAVTPLFDILLGTFVYRPGQAPSHLGVDSSDPGPDKNATFAHLTFPFKPSQ